MPLYKITDKRPSKVKETKLKQEKLVDEHLEDWNRADPSISGGIFYIFYKRKIIFQ